MSGYWGVWFRYWRVIADGPSGLKTRAYRGSNACEGWYLTRPGVLLDARRSAQANLLDLKGKNVGARGTVPLYCSGV